ncbi:RNI-like protein [Xylaria nigripes]|nr:RNI-like protein [Xylaria nigripes]
MSSNNPDQNRPPGGLIRGPQSALTDFLASQNISVARIRADAQARRAAAAAHATSNAAATDRPQQDSGKLDEGSDEDDVIDSSLAAATARRARHQKRKQQQEAIEKIKKSKALKKRKREDGSLDDDLALVLAALDDAPAPIPGQMSHCEICNKRFTVTPYSLTGPKGGFVCRPCGQDLLKDEDASHKHKKTRNNTPKAPVGRRKIQSRILDGEYDVGAKSLMTLCIETLASNIHLADDLGDLPPLIIDRIARRLSKNRLLDPQTLDLFLQRHLHVLNIYDAAKLNLEDFLKIFHLMPQLKTLKLRNAIKFTDSVMQYLTTRNITLESFYIHGANLLSNGTWSEFLKRKGSHLKGLQVYYTDNYFGDATVKLFSSTCPNLRRLKICHNQQISDEGIKYIAKIEKLEHLSLQCIKKINTLPYVSIIQNIGQRLQTFSIKKVPDVDDRLLDAIHEKCVNLSKLRITDSELMTDAGFARLFRGWKNKPLSFIDLQKCRYIDANKPRHNEHMVGLCSLGFEALMEHSGEGLQYLNIHACRHITKEAFENVFASDKTYKHLRYLEISFCEVVNDFIVGSIFRSCPNIKEVNVFGCMKVKDVRVPRGKILVGVPNAVGMRIEGEDA